MNFPDYNYNYDYKKIDYNRNQVILIIIDPNPTHVICFFCHKMCRYYDSFVSNVMTLIKISEYIHIESYRNQRLYGTTFFCFEFRTQE
jgi:hypothetical protein